MRETYIIICYNSEGAINVRKKFGTREDIQDYLMEIILEDARNDRDIWEHGTESIYELDYDGDANGIIGYNAFLDYSINYYAMPYTDIPSVEEKGEN